MVVRRVFAPGIVQAKDVSVRTEKIQGIVLLSIKAYART